MMFQTPLGSWGVYWVGLQVSLSVEAEENHPSVVTFHFYTHGSLLLFLLLLPLLICLS